MQANRKIGMRKRRIFALLLGYVVLLCFLAPATLGATKAKQTLQQATPEPFAVLTLTYDPVTMPVPVVSIRFDNAGPAYFFLVDTGCDAPIIITQWAARQLGMYERGKKITGPDKTGFDRINFAKYVHASLLGSHGKEQCNFDTAYIFLPKEGKGTEDLLSELGVAGVIGLPVFDKNIIQFDFEKKILALYNAPKLLPHSANALLFPLTLNKSGGIFDAQVVVGSVMNKPCKLLIDTGAMDNSLPQEMMPRLKPLLGPQASVVGFSGMENHIYGLLDSVAINGQIEKNVAANWVSPSDFRPPSLGMAFLSRFRMTLDQKNALLVLEQASNHDALAKVLPGTTGFKLNKSGSHFFVDGNSPLIGYTATLKEGDEITSIDGRPLNNLSFVGARNLLNGNVGADATLTVKRGDKTFTESVKRQDPFILFAPK